MKARWLLGCGLLAAIVYVVTVVLGGALRPGYSHIAEPISELTAAGAPNKLLLDLLFLIYNLLVIAFGVGVYGRMGAALTGKITGVALIVSGICGVLLQLFFPQDPGGAQAAVTTTGTLHIVFAGIAALATMIATLCAALWLRKQPNMGSYVIYSLISLVVILIAGGLGAGAATSGNPQFGLIERVTIGAFILWLAVMSIKLYTTAEQPLSSPSGTPQRRPARG
ncbi:MAG: DUF998 domain-containing protein [Anaerolineae bacterium]|nr:DUF998 domain-containing protein [Anaerolineae bacterium]